MGSIRITDQQRRELALHNFVIDENPPGIDNQPWTVYHDPNTGQEHRLPIDAWSFSRYRARGLTPGRATPELREKWKNTQPIRPEAGFIREAPPKESDMQSELIALVLELKKEVAELRSERTGQPVAITLAAEPVAPIEPKQLVLL